RRSVKLPGSEGRWSLFDRGQGDVTNTQRQMAIASQLVDSCGVLTRELVTSRNLPGGFSSVYPVLKAMEETGRVRRGYFVAGLGATQFASPGADDRLRSCSEASDEPKVFVVAATDPANVYGAAVRWPQRDFGAGLRPARTAGARVVICDGMLIGFLGKTSQQLLTLLPEQEPDRTRYRDALVSAIAKLADAATPVFLTQIDGQPAHEHMLAEQFIQQGFVPNHEGLLLRRLQSESTG
ncbi:MAG: hypothetical protein KDB27_06670, partial [Planctomycetales bacterium]|nr:hypothetical protein [Planctomycetales bacterium]